MASPRTRGAKPLTATERTLFVSLNRIALTLPRALDDDLERDSDMSLVEYGVLMHLSEAPDQRLRMAVLARRTALSASRMTRLVDHMASGGLVDKSKVDEDGRGAAATLTPVGLRTLRAAWPAHLASVRRHLFAALQPHEVKAMAECVTRLAGHLDEGAETPCQERGPVPRHGPQADAPC